MHADHARYGDDLQLDVDRMLIHSVGHSQRLVGPDLEQVDAKSGKMTWLWRL